MKYVNITASSRIHLGLLDMARATPRTFGGIGFMIDSPEIQVVATRTSDTQFISPPCIQSATQHYVLTKLRQLLDACSCSPVTVELRGAVREHVGLGSKTAITLATLVAAARLHRIRLTRAKLQLASGRGGASGIGIHGFFTGGLIVDAGRLGQHPLLPSSLHQPTAPPTVLCRVPMPQHWIITLVLPPGNRSSGPTEERFFRYATPVPEYEVLRQFALLYHGLLPAVIENDLGRFGAYLDSFNALGFKAREIAYQNPVVAATMAALRHVAPCVGMSSLGPLVFCISTTSVLPHLPPLPDGTTIIGETRCTNAGFRTDYGATTS